MNEPINIPQSLWEHKLFENPVQLPTVDKSDLAIAVCERKIRVLKNMPSSSDESMPKLLDGYSKIVAEVVKAIEERKEEENYASYRLLLNKIRQSIILTKKSFSSEMYAGIIKSLTRSIEELGLSATCMATTSDGAVDELEGLYLKIIDKIARSHPELAKRYWKQIYKTVSTAIQYNETSDTIRLRPVFKWMIRKLEEYRIQNAKYVDVGCAISQGAPNTILAAQVLRGSGFCKAIHGTDIVEPFRKMVIDFWRAYRIFLYCANPILRPLPAKYHIVLLANVHRHLTFSAQKSLIQNLAQSLYNEGLIFINWRFDKENSPTLVLKKEGSSLVIEDEANTCS